jgi:hypothetical protein
MEWDNIPCIIEVLNLPQSHDQMCQSAYWTKLDTQSYKDITVLLGLCVQRWVARFVTISNTIYSFSCTVTFGSRWKHGSSDYVVKFILYASSSVSIADIFTGNYLHIYYSQVMTVV